MAEPAHSGRRHPGCVPDDEAWIAVGHGFDTDGDGRPDTVLEVDGVDLVVAIDLDGDRFADEVLRIGPDAVVRAVVGPPTADLPAPPLEGAEADGGSAGASAEDQ